MIKMSGLTKKFGGKTVFDGFDLSIEEGKTFCLLGKSGEGKTTLLNMIAGLVCHGGTIEGTKKCAYVFQEPRLIPSLTVEQNIRYAAGKACDTAAILEAVELGHAAKLYPHTLSGGMAQRVSIARAFASKADTVLFDEPFRALDLGLKERMIGLFERLKKESGATVVYVTHDPDEAIACGDRIAVLDGSRLIFDVLNMPAYTLTQRNETVYDALVSALVAR